MPEYRIFNATVTTVSPLHIGTGKALLQEYDYVVHEGRTYRLNEQTLLDAQNVDDPRILQQLIRLPPGGLLKDADYQNADLFRYVIRGVPRSVAPGSELREQIKTVNDQPYLPGSSLKGALRTALAWHGWQEMGLRPDRRLIDENRAKFAARPIEKALFGGDPNHDLLRALQVSDSAPVQPDRLILLNAQVLTMRQEANPRQKGAPVEGVRSETKFRMRLKLDEQLFSTWATSRRDFKLGGEKRWLETLAEIMRAHARQRAQKQKEWYTRRREAERLATFYGQLEGLNLAENQFIVQLGWGGGWDSKTLGSRLQADTQFFDWLVMQPKLQFLKRGVRRSPGAPFPGSRRVVILRRQGVGGGFNETPAVPLGWVLVELEEAAR